MVAGLTFLLIGMAGAASQVSRWAPQTLGQRPGSQPAATPRCGVMTTSTVAIIVVTFNSEPLLR